MFSFKDYLQIVTEDAQADVAQLQMKISELQSRMNQAVMPLQRQLQQLQQMLAQKQKQAQTEQQTQQGQQGPVATPKAAPGASPNAGQPGVGMPGA